MRPTTLTLVATVQATTYRFQGDPFGWALCTASSFVPKIDAALLEGPSPVVNDVVAEIALLREAADAIAADIVRLETARATVEERLAEAYEHRAKIDIRIREIRARQP